MSFINAELQWLCQISVCVWGEGGEWALCSLPLDPPLDASTVIHRCCGNCSQLLSSGNCGRSECLASNAREATFVEVKIDSQIREWFMGEYYCGYTVIICNVYYDYPD